MSAPKKLTARFEFAATKIAYPVAFEYASRSRNELTGPGYVNRAVNEARRGAVEPSVEFVRPLLTTHRGREPLVAEVVQRIRP